MKINDFTVAFDNFELAVREIKAAKATDQTIIFLHDSLGCITLWRDFPEKIVELTGYNALIYDRRGYGQSTAYLPDEQREIDYMETEADILASLFDKLSIQNCSIFGHSDGATIALIAAAKHPKLIDGIMVVGPHIYVEDITQKGVSDTFKAYQSTDLKERLEKYHGFGTDKMVRIWAKIWLSDFFRSWSIESILPKIKCPVLIMQGEYDEFGTMNQVYDIQSKVSGKCTISKIPNAGHTPMKSHPELMLQSLNNFLQNMTQKL